MQKRVADYVVAELACSRPKRAYMICDDALLNQHVRPITELDAATSRHPQLRPVVEGKFHGYGSDASLEHPGRH